MAKPKDDARESGSPARSGRDPSDRSRDAPDDDSRELGELVDEQARKIEKQAREIEKKERQIELTAEVQQCLLPENLPEIEGFDLWASYFAPEKAGGDYYDVLPLERGGGGLWAAIVADAAGHGPSATVVMAMVHSFLHAFPGPHDTPGAALEFINRKMCAKDLAGMFATAVLGLLDTAKKDFRYAVAGHPAPLLKPAAGGAVTELASARGIGLGVKKKARFEGRLFRFEASDTLLLYTDGLIEAMDRRGEPFGVERLKRALGQAAGGPEAIGRFVNRAVAAHRGIEDPTDDKTFLIIQARDRPGGRP